MAYDFLLVREDQPIRTVGAPVCDSQQALAVAKRLAIASGEANAEYSDGTFVIAVIDEGGHEIHRENIQSACKSG